MRNARPRHIGNIRYVEEKDWMRLVVIGLIALIGACGSPPSGQAEVTANVVSDASRIAAMPEGERHAVFIRAIRDAGFECQHVEASRAAGAYRDRPVREAVCVGGGHWTIMLTDTGAQIIDADETHLAMDSERNRSRP